MKTAIEKKNRTITLRCSETEYQRILKAAKQLDLTITDYMLDTRVPEIEKMKEEKKKQQRRIIAFVELCQTLNELGDCLQAGAEADKIVKIDKVYEEGMKLWGN